MGLVKDNFFSIDTFAVDYEAYHIDSFSEIVFLQSSGNVICPFVDIEIAQNIAVDIEYLKFGALYRLYQCSAKQRLRPFEGFGETLMILVFVNLIISEF